MPKAVWLSIPFITLYISIKNIFSSIIPFSVLQLLIAFSSLILSGFHSFPPGSGGFMNMTERRTETSPQHGYYRSSFGSIRNPDVRARSDQNPQTNSVTSSSISNMQEYDYGGI